MDFNVAVIFQRMVLVALNFHQDFVGWNGPQMFEMFHRVLTLVCFVCIVVDGNSHQMMVTAVMFVLFFFSFHFLLRNISCGASASPQGGASATRYGAILTHIAKNVKQALNMLAFLCGVCVF